MNAAAYGGRAEAYSITEVQHGWPRYYDRSIRANIHMLALADYNQAIKLEKNVHNRIELLEARSWLEPTEKKRILLRTARFLNSTRTMDLLCRKEVTELRLQIAKFLY